MSEVNLIRFTPISDQDVYSIELSSPRESTNGFHNNRMCVSQREPETIVV